MTPEPKHAFTGDTTCRICGRPAHAFGQAWAHKHALPESFGPLDSFAVPDSPAVFGACVHFGLGKTFHAAVAARGFDVKMWPHASWRTYSHLLSGSGGWVIPRKAEWRAFLTIRRCRPS